MRPLPTLIAAAALLAAAPASAEKYALSVFHFNVQYVAGGTLGYFSTPNPVLDLDNDATEDLIVTESFAPVLDLFEKHPSWGTDIELQGYLLDVLAARHPAVLAKLRTLAKSGQIDVVSFHYSDQLFIAYPAADWERSQALTAATFAKYDIPLSRSVFCQEGQAGEGLAARMAERGYRNMIWPKNLWGYQHQDFAAAPSAAPLYKFGDVYMVAGAKGVSFSEGSLTIETTWTFLDDGELLATDGLNPYFPDIFRHKPEAVKAYEDKLLALEAAGYQIATVDEYVDAVKDRVTPVEPPPLFDGTWQPNSTSGVFRWLGGKGLFVAGERDNHVRSLNAVAHRELTAAETAAALAGLDVRAELDGAWRLLFLGQVTDASGINPFRGEIEYGLSHTTEALRIARDVIRRAKPALGNGELAIDPIAATATPVASGSEPLRGEPVAAPFELELQLVDRTADQVWELVAPGHHRVELRFSGGLAREVAVSFPGELADELITTRALADGVPATYRRTEFSFEQFWLPLPTGLVSLGPSRFVIQDQGFVKVAAKITRDSGLVEFRDQTVPLEETATWVFHVFEGSTEAALELARRINVDRTVVR
jgi:hypothetical protein